MHIIHTIRRELDIFLTALMFYTRIPVPTALNYTYNPEYLPLSSRYFPFIGWIVGGLAGLTYWLTQLWWPNSVALLFSMAASIAITGAIHEDGWADVCDGFFGGYTKDRILTIMKDSRLGTYGTIGLLLMLGLKFALLLEIATNPLALPLILWTSHSISRLAAISLIYTHEYVSESNSQSQASKSSGLATTISVRSLLAATGFGLLPLFFMPIKMWLVLPLIIIVTVIMTRWFVKRIGGYTGDCLGAVQQVTELVLYLLGLLFRKETEFLIKTQFL